MKIITADSLEHLSELESESIHAVVTDPPYGLAFMGKDWDDFEPKEYQEWCEKWATEVKRVLKPGGHMLAFSGNRTHHRLFTGVEDAGFEIRDTLTWHYGSGFPKASDISKTIDKRADAEREIVGAKEYAGGHTQNSNELGRPIGTFEMTGGDERQETKPATADAKQWDGFKTGLKPSTEFVVMARKPFDGATVDCVLEHGTGALNIDATRIESAERPNMEPLEKDGDIYGSGLEGGSQDGITTEGRYPSNLIFGEDAAEQLDAEVETATGGRGHQYTEGEKVDNDIFGDGFTRSGQYYEDQEHGGPSRYFYTSKATKAERTLDGRIDNAHPTVKPTDLMKWLVKLVTAEGQTVLDPFTGSGTTGMACKALNRDFIGIERKPEYADIARVRCGLTPNDPSVVRGDDNQHGLHAFK